MNFSFEKPYKTKTNELTDLQEKNADTTGEKAIIYGIKRFGNPVCPELYDLFHQKQ